LRCEICDERVSMNDLVSCDPLWWHSLEKRATRRIRGGADSHTHAHALTRTHERTPLFISAAAPQPPAKVLKCTPFFPLVALTRRYDDRAAGRKDYADAESPVLPHKVTEVARPWTKQPIQVMAPAELPLQFRIISYRVAQQCLNHSQVCTKSIPSLFGFVCLVWSFLLTRV